MNTFATITKIELKKLFQRKDSWLMFTVLLVPILYSVGLAANSEVITYTGAGNITAIGFASNVGMEVAQIICNCIFWLITIFLALYKLSSKERDVILLRYFQSMSDQEIAELYHVSRSAIYRRRSNGLKKLKIVLKERN